MLWDNGFYAPDIHWEGYCYEILRPTECVLTMIYVHFSFQLTGVFTPDEIQAQFKEAPQFASHLSKLFVQEVRRRATNQSTGKYLAELFLAAISVRFEFFFSFPLLLRLF